MKDWKNDILKICFFFHSLTNNMASEIVLEVNIIIFLHPVCVNKHSLEVVREKVCVCGQVKFEMSGFGKEDNIF